MHTWFSNLFCIMFVGIFCPKQISWLDPESVWKSPESCMASGYEHKEVKNLWPFLQYTTISNTNQSKLTKRRNYWFKLLKIPENRQWLNPGIHMLPAELILTTSWHSFFINFISWRLLLWSQDDLQQIQTFILTSQHSKKKSEGFHPFPVEVLGGSISGPS